MFDEESVMLDDKIEINFMDGLAEQQVPICTNLPYGDSHVLYASSSVR